MNVKTLPHGTITRLATEIESTRHKVKRELEQDHPETLNALARMLNRDKIKRESAIEAANEAISQTKVS
jgi:hypothetical protein